MEPFPKHTALLSLLVSTKLVLYTVLQYIDSQDLNNLYIALKNSANQKYSLLSDILEPYIYIRLHINRTDRSYYFFVYQNPSFLEIEKRTIAYLVQSTNQFKELSQIRILNRKFISENIGSIDAEQIINQIEELSDNPEIPMLKLLRETVGIGATSIFQNFLASLDQDMCQLSSEEYPNLSEFYQHRSNQVYISQFFQASQSNGTHPNYRKFKVIRIAPYLIKFNEREIYEIQNNQIHNFILGLFLLSDQLVNASYTYLNGISDLHYRLLEFCLRYSLYRNFILSIQEKFGFVFFQYQTYYQQTFGKDNQEIPPLTFWRPAMSKWITKMQGLHRELIDTYNSYILDERKRNLMNFIENMDENNLPSDYVVIRNKLNVLGIPYILNNHDSRDVLGLISDEIEMCVSELADYIIDMSINEQSVHWCAHTKQILSSPFNEFEKQVIDSNIKFYEQLGKIGFPASFIKFLVEADLKFVQEKQFYKGKIFFDVVRVVEELMSGWMKNKFSFDQERFESMDKQIERSNEKGKWKKCTTQQNLKQLWQIKSKKGQQLVLSLKLEDKKQLNEEVQLEELLERDNEFEKQETKRDQKGQVTNSISEMYD